VENWEYDIVGGRRLFKSVYDVGTQFYVEKGVPSNHCWYQKTDWIDFSYGIKLISVLGSFLS